MSNHAYIRILEQEGHTVVFEQKVNKINNNQLYFAVEETKGTKGQNSKYKYDMTHDEGYQYMDKLISLGYIGYN